MVWTRRKKIWTGVGIGAGVMAIVAAVVIARISWKPYDEVVSAVDVDLQAPQLYVSTPSLARLPRELIQAPVLRDVLTEDFAFYYEEHEDRLGLNGTLKRIAFEHEPTLADDLLAQALNQPAEIAWWTDAKSAPRYWMLAMTQGALARTLQTLGTWVASDSQVSIIATVDFNGSEAKVFAVRLSTRRTLAMVSQGERVVVVSDPGLLFDAENKIDPSAHDVVQALLSKDAAKQAVFRSYFGLHDNPEGHTLVADANLLAQGYEHFMPGIKALRMDIAANGKDIHTLLRLDATLDPELANNLVTDSGIWAALPTNAAACTVLPVDWAQLPELLQNDEATDASANAQTDAAARKTAHEHLAAQLSSSAAICWYASGQVQSPLVLAQLKSNDAASTKEIEELARWALNNEVKARPLSKYPQASLWQSTVYAPWSRQRDSKGSVYHPSVAVMGRWVSFSPDDALVQLALDAQAKHYPSMADTLPKQGATLATVAPKYLADMAQQESMSVLGPDEPTLNQAAQLHWLPMLNALRKLPSARTLAAGKPDANGWVTLDWQTLATSSP